jgi:hypothetical protein
MTKIFKMIKEKRNKIIILKILMIIIRIKINKMNYFHNQKIE